MLRVQGFISRLAAQKFKQENGQGIVCGTDIHVGLYKDCIAQCGLDSSKYPYAVVWNDYGGG